MNKWMIGITVALSVGLLTACGGGDSEEAGDVNQLTMGFVPSQDADEIATTVEPLQERLSEELGVEIDAEVMTNYTALVEGMRTQTIDIGFLPPFGFVQAEERAEVNVLLKAIRHGDDSYLAQFVVREDSDINDIDDIINSEPGELTWSFGDVTSTAGYLFPASHLMDLGIEEVDEHFIQQTVGGHDNALQSLLDGQADFATTFDDARDNFADENPDIYDELTVIEHTDPIPNDTISVRSEMNEELAQEIKDVFLSFNDDEEMMEVMEEVYDWTGVAEASSEDYEIVRETYERFAEIVEE
ncbi:phosphate/phosphite/phosphonate ABC transporter substrate-binding protein [Bacillus sp. FJAT-44742]|uniref:phosphate/phosphite/phosphonate ABC transporter substrate-binding protein n=1 Tax=Bacillus sp. FJAT-44742 TaxID=2014005 RepID=UPI000C24C8CD|nr:phosphate/phosphite/phosphonate ABC transporter substrate-binding protein [Bacillus sp. FJAT-44742]